MKLKFLGIELEIHEKAKRPKWTGVQGQAKEIRL